MKKGFLFIVVITCIGQIHAQRKIVRKNPEFILISFAQEPVDEKQHHTWNEYIRDAVHEVNQWLVDQGLIAPLDACPTKELPQKKSWFASTFFRKKSSYFPYKPNCILVARFDEDFGTISLHIPPCAPRNEVITKFTQSCKKRGVPVDISIDLPVKAERHPDLGLEGISLSLATLEKLKNGGSFNSKVAPNIEKEIKESLFWYHYLPTTGLRRDDTFARMPYPFLPHCFTLWELAPARGKGAKIALVDTGVAAFAIQGAQHYRKNYDLVMQCPMQHSYNIVSDYGLDPLEQFTELLRTYIYASVEQASLEKRASEIIKEYLEYRTTKLLEHYLMKNGHRALIDAKHQLNEQGQKALKTLTRTIERTFSLVYLDSPYNGPAIQQFLPLAKISPYKSTFIAGHGSHTFGIIGGQVTNTENDETPEGDIGICGLAPAADIIMIKAFQDDGSSNKSTLIAALKKSIQYRADIVNLSLKIADSVNRSDRSTQVLENILGLIPYVVAASGNGGDPRLKNYTGPGEAYPARFENVDFDVGAFRYKENSYPIVSFSQYESGYGPKIVAPGYNILSSGLVPDQSEDSMYVFMGGTSMAAPIMTGFLALVLGEFKNDFNQEQIKTVIYKSTIKMHNDADWRDKTIFGVVDMRTALFTFHIIKQFKKVIAEHHSNYNVDQHFNNVVQSIHNLLFSWVEQFSTQYLHNIGMKDQYASFLNASLKIAHDNSAVADTIDKRLATLLPQRKLEYALNGICSTLLHAVDDQHKAPHDAFDAKTLASVHKLLHAKEIDLFAYLEPKIRQQLVKSKRVEHYWKEQAERIKKAYAL